MEAINNVVRYRFKQDYHFDNDIYDVKKLGSNVLEWKAKKGDIVFGKISESTHGHVSVIISPSKEGYVCLVSSDILEEIQ
jgi:hypothetical protein